MTGAVDELLRRFASAFGRPASDNPEGLVAEYRRALAFYDDKPKILRRAANIVIDSRENPFWPPVGVVRKAIEKAIAETAPPPAPPQRQEPTPPTAEERARADALVAALRRAVAAMDMATDKPPPEPLDTSRPVFEAMQDYSPNRRLHRVKQ